MSKVYGNRWEIIKPLPEGGQAHTFLVKDNSGKANGDYVLKRLKNKKRIERFKQEIEATTKLSHENIVRIIDSDLNADNHYLVTEYCSGGSLAEAKPFWQESPIKALEVFLQICSGVHHAHVKNPPIIHRDLKPENIFLRTEVGPAVIGDFGICFIEDGKRVTLTEEAVGPRLYTAPELEDGREEGVSTKSDVYSLGKILYWLLSGGRQFAREKYREQRWDLKGHNEDSLLGWNNIHMEHINRILDLMIVPDPNDRRGVYNITLYIKRAIYLLDHSFIPIDKNIKMPCQFCGEGRYELRANGYRDGVADFGLQIVSSPDWRIFTCTSCGHVQKFRVDKAGEKKWWEGH